MVSFDRSACVHINDYAITPADTTSVIVDSPPTVRYPADLAIAVYDSVINAIGLLGDDRRSHRFLDPNPIEGIDATDKWSDGIMQEIACGIASECFNAIAEDRDTPIDIGTTPIHDSRETLHE